MPLEVKLPELDISVEGLKRFLGLKATTPPEPYIRYVHVCGRCGVLFHWPSRSKLFCPKCTKERERLHWIRTNRKRWAKRKPLPEGVSRRNTCARCGSPIGKRKRFCVVCRRVRMMDGDARRQRMKNAAMKVAFNSDSVPAEQYAPTLTKE